MKYDDLMDGFTRLLYEAKQPDNLFTLQTLARVIRQSYDEKEIKVLVEALQTKEAVTV